MTNKSPQIAAEETAEKLTDKINALFPFRLDEDELKVIEKAVIDELNLPSLLTAAKEHDGLVKDKERIVIRMNKQIEQLLNHCGDCECEKCAVVICPFEDPLHFHHDGCPSCVNVPSGVICPNFDTDKMIELAITTAIHKGEQER